MIKIEHIAMWCRNLEAQRKFYETYFGASSNRKYVNKTKGFESCFISFDSGARLELMCMSSIPESTDDPRRQHTGLIHFAISVGAREKVDELTEKIKMAGHEVIDGPRTTGDGYYESVVLDPENNRIEITV